MLIKASELRSLDVINVHDGRRLGYIYDVDIDVNSGKIVAVILPGFSKGWLFGRGQEIEIPWEKVIRVGVDVVLVQIDMGPSYDRRSKDFLRE